MINAVTQPTNRRGLHLAGGITEARQLCRSRAASSSGARAPPPTETNFACAWLTGVAPGDLAACAAAASAFAAAVVDVAARPQAR